MAYLLQLPNTLVIDIIRRLDVRSVLAFRQVNAQCRFYVSKARYLGIKRDMRINCNCRPCMLLFFGLVQEDFIFDIYLSEYSNESMRLGSIYWTPGLQLDFQPLADIFGDFVTTLQAKRLAFSDGTDQRNSDPAPMEGWREFFKLFTIHEKFMYDGIDQFYGTLGIYPELQISTMLMPSVLPPKIRFRFQVVDFFILDQLQSLLERFANCAHDCYVKIDIADLAFAGIDASFANRFPGLSITEGGNSEHFGFWPKSFCFALYVEYDGGVKLTYINETGCVLKVVVRWPNSSLFETYRTTEEIEHMKLGHFPPIEQALEHDDNAMDID